MSAASEAGSAARQHGWWAIPIVLLGYAGYIKGSPFVSNLPGDLTFEAAALLTVLIAVAFLRGCHDRRSSASIVMFFLLLTPGIAYAGDIEKVQLLFSFTLLCALAPAVLMTSTKSHLVFAGSLVIAAILMSAAALLFPDDKSLASHGRLALVGSNTIGTSRVIGAGIVVVVVLTLTIPRWRLLFAAVGVWLFVVTVAIGSRGPLLSVLLSVSAVLVFAKEVRRRRTVAVGMVLALATLALWFVSRTGSGGGQRLREFLNGESDEIRSRLIDEALTRIAHHPLGAGWGYFGTLGFTEGGARVTYPHNMILEVALEGGWIAGLGLLALTFLSIRGYVLNSIGPLNSALLGVGIYWISVSQTSSDVNWNRMTWVSLGLGLVVGNSEHAKDFDVPRAEEALRALD
jgi:O-antigen ligase